MRLEIKTNRSAFCNMKNTYAMIKANKFFTIYILKAKLNKAINV